MTLQDTINLMTSDDYKDRFKAEYQQLDIRLSGLVKMLDKYKAGTLPFKPKCSFELLHKQFQAMGSYKEQLIERAKIEGIEL